MKIGWLIYNGFSTKSHEIYTTGKMAHNSPERDVTTFQIAGRNGDFFVDNGRYQNIEVAYPCFVNNFSAHEQEIRNAFGRVQNVYWVLSDTYDPDHFRLARCIGGVEFEPFRGNMANFQVTFDCDPRRFLNDGADAVGITGTLTLTNPTPFDAKPLIRINDPTDGTVITITNGQGRIYELTATDDGTGEIVIDCDQQDIYRYVNGAKLNLNGLFDVEDFPALTEGQNTIGITGTYSSADIAPRWWEL